MSLILKKKICLLSCLDFETWKAALEHRTNSFYATGHSGKKFPDGRILKYFYCNRSGFHDRKNKRKDETKKTRQLKAQGSCKLEGYCPSHIVYKLDGQNIKVDFTVSHYGHELEPRHIRLPDKTRDAIRGDLEK